MSSINRGTLPQNFLDHVSQGGMRLPTPEPQYWFAKAAMGARLRLAAMQAGIPSAERFVSMQGGGGDVLPPDLAELARAADAYPGIINVVDDFGIGKGDTIKFQRDIYNATTSGWTEDDRELKADASVSTTGQTVQQEEVPVVLKQYHGPYASSAVAPYAILEFDKKYRANKEALESITRRHLSRDYVKWLDTVIRDKFRETTTITYPSAVTNVLDFTAGAGHGFDLETFFNARKTISDREWQKFSNGRYIALVPTSFNIDMLGDVDYRELSKSHGVDRNLLFGYIGSVQDLDFFECSTLKSYAAGDTVPDDANAVPTSAAVEEALIIGPGAVGMGTALAPEARWADDTNYGTVAKVIWLALHAFQTLDIRGVQRVLAQSA